MRFFVKTGLLFFIVLLTFPKQAIGQQKENREYHQLITYTIKNEEQEKKVDVYLRDSFIPAAKRNDIQNIGVFKLRPGKFVEQNKIFVLLPFNSLTQFEELEKKLLTDKRYIESGSGFLNASYNSPPFERINSILMRAFEGMPKMKPSSIKNPRKERVYELRSYESSTVAKYWNKVAMFNAGGEIALFSKLGFNAVFYSEVISGNHMPNLMYMTTFKNMETRDTLWKAFFSSDKWSELKMDENYKNNVSKAEIMLLYPTSYSDY
ncbi:NIPSNAP family protein [Maribacter sp. 2304DJ31-5]|uniref:NIPSNAP family protein n=1 Tax=Maribacter sp. 2304DJ31-5 TaxID=3386273 RepID=UPI0039BD3845